MTWDRNAIEDGLDRRTVATREIRKVLDLAEAEMARRDAESRKSLELYRDETEDALSQTEFDMKQLAAENAALRELHGKYQERLKLYTERAVADETLMIQVHHPGQPKNPRESANWWLLGQLEETLVNLRVQGAEDDTQVFLTDDVLEVSIPAYGFVPVTKKTEVVAAPKKRVLASLDRNFVLLSALALTGALCLVVTILLVVLS